MTDTPLSVADVLERAADLIEPEGAWTQKAIGRDADGNDVRRAEDLDRAVCFCAAGAIWKVAGPENRFVVQQAFSILNDNGANEGVGPWNDARGRKQPEVVAKLRTAASQARRAATLARAGDA